MGLSPVSERPIRIAPPPSARRTGRCSRRAGRSDLESSDDVSIQGWADGLGQRLDRSGGYRLQSEQIANRSQTKHLSREKAHSDRQFVLREPARELVPELGRKEVAQASREAAFGGRGLDHGSESLPAVSGVPESKELRNGTRPNPGPKFSRTEDALHQRSERRAQRLEEKVLLASKVVEDQRRIDSGFARYRSDADVVNPLAREQSLSSANNVLSSASIGQPSTTACGPSRRDGTRNPRLPRPGRYHVPDPVDYFNTS